jgi:phospholipid transport system substrate-binding protein
MIAEVINRRWLQGITAGFMLTIFGAFWVTQANAAETDQAEAFVQDLAASGIAMLESGNYTETERELQFRKLVRKGFALDAIGKFVVGRYWREMNKDQQAEYLELFSEWLMKTYASRLGGYSGQTLEIARSIETDSRYKDVVVSTQINLANGQQPMNADWRVRKFGGEYKIIDVSVEGASMVATQRREFEAVIRKVGVDGLMDELRDRLAVLVANSG